MLRTRLAISLLTIAALGTSCGKKPTASATTESDLALPVTAPMRARERLLDDLDRHNQDEKQRRTVIDSLIPGRSGSSPR